MRIQRPTSQPHPRSGFTLIELLIVIVIASILATIAIPAFAQARTQAFTAMARSDLRNLHIAQDSHFNDHRTYSGDLLALGVRPSSSVSITVIEQSATGWSATAIHPNGQCAIYYGSATPLSPATISTVVGCD